MKTRNEVVLVRAAGIGLALAMGIGMGGTAAGAVLTGSGPHLPIPGPNPGEPLRQEHALSGITTAGFDGTWTAPAQPAWHGTFKATGPVPAGTANPAGATRYDFTTLANGSLPIGTYFRFGDVDMGSGVIEQFLLKAFDASGSLLTSEWLDEPIGVSGSGISPINTPGWAWDAGASEYLIDGSTISPANPSLNVWIENNQEIHFLEVIRTERFANFSLSAPLVPGPGSAALVGIGGLMALRRRR